MTEPLKVAVRPRSAWEATDLGLALLRAQAGPVYRTWLSGLLPLTLVLTLACRHTPWLPPLLIWWLKPLLVRPILHVLARATFGQAPGVAGTWREAPRYCRRGVFASLLWRRFSLERGLLLPVWQLEEPSMRAFHQRRRVLLQRGRAQTRLLTLVFLLFNLVLMLGVLAGLAYFRPGSGGPDILAAVFASRGQRLPWLDVLLPLLPTLAAAALEPVYVAAGFGLYLNRRVQLEGWDLEQAFRLLARRARAGHGLLLVFLLACAGLGLGAQPQPAPAGTEAKAAPAGTEAKAAPAGSEARPAPARSEAKVALEEVLKDPEFASRRQTWRLHLRRRPGPEVTLPSPSRITGLVQGLARLLKLLIPAGLALWLGLALWRHRRSLAPILGRPREPAPDAILGLDIRPRGLPADLPEAAARLWDQGDPRAALALLYRGALAHLVHGRGLALGASATETECLRLAGPVLPAPGADYFARLTATWLRVAYGARPVGAAERTLCQDWASHFQVPVEQP